MHFVAVPLQAVHASPQWVGELRTSTQDPPHRACPVGQPVSQVGPSLRQPYVHVVTVGVWQLPAPSHSAAVDALPFVHEAAAPHDTVAAG